MAETTTRATRTTRAQESRSAEPLHEEYSDTWHPGGALDIPEFIDNTNYAFLWVRTAIRGEPDMPNAIKHYRMGYRPIPADEVPTGVMCPTTAMEEQGNVIGYRGMVLMRIPKARKAVIDKHHHERADDLARSIRENQFLRDAGRTLGAPSHFSVTDRVGRDMPMSAED